MTLHTFTLLPKLKEGWTFPNFLHSINVPLRHSRILVILALQRQHCRSTMVMTSIVICKFKEHVLGNNFQDSVRKCANMDPFVKYAWLLQYSQRNYHFFVIMLVQVVELGTN